MTADAQGISRSRYVDNLQARDAVRKVDILPARRQGLTVSVEVQAPRSPRMDGVRDIPCFQPAVASDVGIGAGIVKGFRTRTVCDIE